jgi:hypothetical protein
VSARWRDALWLIRLLALAVMFELSFFRDCAPQDAGACLRGGRSSLFVSRPAPADFLPMPPCAALRGSPMLQGWTLRKPTSADQILDQIVKLEEYLNAMEIIPSTSLYRTSVLLALLSKALATSRAICALINAGFPIEAFGLSRTLIEIYFTARFIGNQDTEKRAKRFVDFGSRVQKEWQTLAKKYSPKTPLEKLALDAEILKVAETFKNKANWTGLHGQTKAMAQEEDYLEKIEQDAPYQSEFDYDVNYFWTSLYVHATVVGIRGHASVPGTVFKVRAGNWADASRGNGALFNVAAYLCKTVVVVFRAINEDQPESVHELFGLMSLFIRDDTL